MLLWQGKERQPDEALCCDGRWLAASRVSPLNTVAGTKKRETATADCPAASLKIKIFVLDVMIFEPLRLTFETETKDN